MTLALKAGARKGREIARHGKALPAHSLSGEE
jgi:hypothetical protein